MTEKDLYADEPELVITTVAGGDDDAHDDAEEAVPAEQHVQARNMMEQGQS
ncbi:hypothetical protein OHS33_34645 [Streptomyces sp. NBC_00536]|uniref:hypothetical protein n=1 Tax=Streptomyces sp. NBC_00536 TaxID=2975769 RepID=UPI002E80FA44|nr:hypothetical protein [Streptomyces sp. NBC_00536]WUC83059.1 hypothetical protein OHS33_34645 [Streptomyces sp. NBC_00536]